MIFVRWVQEFEKPIIPRSIEEFFAYLQDVKKLSNTSLNTYRAALLSLEKYLVDRGISQQFMDGFGNYRQAEPDIIPLSNEEVRLLKRGFVPMRNMALAQAYQDLTVYLLDSGDRWEDARMLKVKNINITGQEVSYIQLKNGKRKVIYIEEPLFSILKSRCSQDPENLVFVNSHGNALHYPDYYQYLKKLARSVGITKRVSPHIPRHSYGQNSYDQTGDVLLTRDLLGQKSINSAMRYVHNSQRRIKEGQQTHPHIAENVDPTIRIEIIEKGIQEQKLGSLRQFNALLVKKATNAYIEALYEAILPKRPEMTGE